MNMLASTSSQISLKQLLLIRPSQLEGEGYQSYLTRLCQANRLPGPTWLAERLSLSYFQLAMLGPETFRRLLRGELTMGAVLIQRDRKYCSLHWRRFGIYMATRLCTQCLRENQPPKGEWDWPLTISCRDHKRLLINRCPVCNDGILHTRHRVCFCECGADFRDFYSDPEPAWTAKLTQLFSARRVSDLSDDADAHRLDRLAFNVLRAFLPPIEERARSRGGLANGTYETVLTPEMYAEVGKLLQGWPEEFKRRVKTWLQISHGGAVSLIKRIALLGLNEVEDAARGVLEEDRGAQRRSRANALARSECEIKSVHGLAVVMGISEHTVIKYISNGKLKGTVQTPKASGEKVQSVVISPAVSRELRRLHDSTLRRKEAADRLGCTPLFLNILARAGLVPYIAFTPESTGWRFRHDELDKLRDRFLSRATAVRRGSALKRLIELKPKHIKGHPDPSWARFVGQLFSGDAPLFRIAGEEPTFGALAIDTRVTRVPKQDGE